MKSIIPQDQKPRTLSYIIIIAAGMAMLALLLYFTQVVGAVKELLDIISPFLLGIMFALIQLPILKRVEQFFNRFIFKKKPHPKVSRVIGTVVSLVALLVLFTAFMLILLPQLYTSIQQLIQYITKFLNENKEQINSLLEQHEFYIFEGEKMMLSWEKITTQILGMTDYIAVVMNNLMAISNTIYNVIFKVFVGLITAFYILVDKEHICAQIKKICYAVFKKDTCENMIYWTRRANAIFAGFITGKILDSLIIGILCYFGMLVFRIEYPLLISVIVGITNVIPFFGPFIGAIPSILILLIINPYSALWFSIFILVLQQLDGNIIGPFILGDYVGMSPLLIMITIVVGGGLFGFTGMILSVPVFALIYAIAQAGLTTKLEKRNLPADTKAYTDMPKKD